MGLGELKDKAACMEHDDTREIEQPKAEPLGTQAVHVGRKGRHFEEDEEIVGDDIEAPPSGIGAETSCWKRTAGQFVLGVVVAVFDGALLLPVPVEKFQAGTVVVVGNDGEVAPLVLCFV